MWGLYHHHLKNTGNISSFLISATINPSPRTFPFHNQSSPTIFTCYFFSIFAKTLQLPNLPPQDFTSSTQSSIAIPQSSFSLLGTTIFTTALRRMGLVEEIYGPQLEKEQSPTSVYEYQNTPENRSWAGALPVKQGLYDPEYEKDACGVGFAASVTTESW